MVIFRENTEGAYVNVGGNFKNGLAGKERLPVNVKVPSPPRRAGGLVIDPNG